MSKTRLKSILLNFKPAALLWLAVLPLVWWALKDIQWTAVAAAIGRMTAWQVLALLGIDLVTLMSFSGTWWLILRAQGYRVPYLALVGYRAASFGVSYFTLGPQLGGEPLQVYLLVRNHAVPGPAAAASTALDKVLELLVNFLFLSAGILLTSQWRVFPGLSQAGALLALLALFGLLASFMLMSYLGWTPMTLLLERIPIRTSGYQRVVKAVNESEQHVSRFCREHPRTLALALTMGVATWGLMLLEHWLGLYFLGLPLTLQQLTVAMTLNRLSFLAPLPAGLGVLEGSQVLAMSVLGFDPAIGVSQGLIIRARDILVGLTGLGIGWAAGRWPPPRKQSADV